MATLKKLGMAGPGSSVSIDRRLGLLRIQTSESEVVVQVFGPRPGPLNRDRLPRHSAFSAVVDIPLDVDWHYDFIRLEVDDPKEFPLDEKLIDAVNAGSYYTMPLSEAGQKVFGAAGAGTMVILLGRIEEKCAQCCDSSNCHLLWNRHPNVL